MKTNEEYLQEYIQTRGLGEKSYYKLKSMLNHYSEYQGLTIHELITEADNEEEQGIRWKRRTLKTRLINYRNYCKENMKLSSAKAYYKIIRSFYHHHEISIGNLPAWNMNNATVSPPIQYNDLPTKDIIRRAVEISEPLMKALLLFLSSTGMSKIDCLSLTVQDYINATYTYHHTNNILDAVQVMMESDVDIIPTFKMRRSKTNKYFVTFCSPESVQAINNYLVLRNEKNKQYGRGLNGADKLFKISESHYQNKFMELNDTLGLGKCGTFNRLRGHMLRKFHASNLEKAGMDRYKVNVLQGKSNGAVDDVYFFEDEETLKNEYVKALDGLLIFTMVKEVNQYSDDYLELLEENKMLKDKLEKVDKLQEQIDEIKSWWVFD